MERFFDVVLSFIALIFFTPLFLLVILILTFTGEGEILFLQERVGMRGCSFRLVKFATMLKDSPNIATGTITIEGDPRILPFGRFLRKSKINELPQLLNVFFGQMSLIGPRPMTRQTFLAYSEQSQDAIVKVKPGLSGIGSVLFSREEKIMSGKNATTEYYNSVVAPYKGELEKWFVREKNIRVYFKLIALTVYVIVRPNTDIVWKVFPTLPIPPKELEDQLMYIRL